MFKAEVKVHIMNSLYEVNFLEDFIAERLEAQPLAFLEITAFVI